MSVRSVRSVGPVTATPIAQRAMLSAGAGAAGAITDSGLSDATISFSESCMTGQRCQAMSRSPAQRPSRPYGSRTPSASVSILLLPHEEITGMTSLATVLSEVVEKHSERPALRLAEQVWTYAELTEQVRATAGMLAVHGIGPDTRVGLVSANVPLFPIAF